MHYDWHESKQKWSLKFINFEQERDTRLKDMHDRYERHEFDPPPDDKNIEANATERMKQISNMPRRKAVPEWSLVLEA